MNKILKIVAVFVLGIGVLTGCTDKVAQKITNDTEKTQDVTTNMLKDDANVDEQNQQENKGNNVVNKNENQTIAPTNRNNTNKYNHNFNEAGKILELMNYSLLNFKGSTAANAIRYSVIDNGTDNQIVFAPATYVLDLINTYNEGTYNLKDVFAKLNAERGITFIELDKSKVEYTQEELEKLVKDTNTIVYFKKDNAFALRYIAGIGGATDSIFAPVERWEVQGDRIIIPFVTIATNRPTGVITLRLNNKQYASGQHKTMYYIEKFVIY